MDVKLVWIPSHVGIQDNESADRLAREAIRTGRDTQYGIPTSEVSNVWKLNMYEDMFKWVKEEATRRGAWYCNNFLNESRYTWFNKFNISRRTVTTINRLRSGHTSLRASLFRFQIVDSPMCVRCDVEKTPNHVFWGCIGYEEQRKVFQKALVHKRGLLPHPVEYLLATLREDIIYVMEKFLWSINKGI